MNDKMLENMADAIIKKEKISTTGVSEGLGGRFMRRASNVFAGEFVTHFSAFDDDVKIGYDMVHFEMTDDGRYAEVDRFGQPLRNGASKIRKLDNLDF